jgi:hypothetical protein
LIEAIAIRNGSRNRNPISLEEEFSDEGRLGKPPEGGRNGERDFHGEKRSTATHASMSDPDARLNRKANGARASCASRATR